MDENKKMDIESMNKYVEEEFEFVKTTDLYLCEDICEADFMYYCGYFAMAAELGVITPEREDEMMDEIREIYKKLKGNSPAGQELHKKRIAKNANSGKKR